MQPMDVAAFRERYPEWLESTRPLLESANWKEAFQTYPHVINEDAPWSPLQKPLSQCRLAVLTTAGLYVKGEQPRFRAEDIEGDWTFRELPSEVQASQLGIAHDHFDHSVAEADLNSVFPLERLRELEGEGLIGGLASRHYSVSGYCTRADLVAEAAAPQIAQRAVQDNVDVLFHVPV